MLDIPTLGLELPDDEDASILAVDRQSFKIRLADTQGQRNTAGMLVNRMYSWRGYSSTPAAAAVDPHRITLTAADKLRPGITAGTLSVHFDSPEGLLADQLYRDDIDPLRKQGRKLCELTKLAFRSGLNSKQGLASLFHIAYIYARHIHHHTDLFIEVNPRHVKFYEKMLGFTRFGEEKINPRVNAPGVLLWLDLEYVSQQVRQFGGKIELVETEKSLYPYGFSPAEEDGITGRIRELK